MHNRFWWWIGIRLFGAVALVSLILSFLMPGSGEREFKKTLAAMKQVHSFRAVYLANPGTQVNDLLWEVDCGRQIVHEQSHHVDTSFDPPKETAIDQLRVGHLWYTHQSDGRWAKTGFSYQGGSPMLYCAKIAEGSDSGILPNIATMLKRGIIQKGEKKTVNGVQCREWDVALKGPLANLEHDTVCIGIEDHLPYEVTVDWQKSRASFSDYNTQIQIDVPEVALQAASATNGSN
jgi:hypothetical protein